MRANKILLGFAATICVATTAMADTTLGWYVAGDGGGHNVSTKSLSLQKVKLISREASSEGSSSSSGSSSEFAPLPEPAVGQSFEVKTKHEFAGFARLGYRFTPHIRSELEVGRREADLSSKLPLAVGNGSGRLTMDSAMINVIYDIAPSSKLHPFVGLGLGAVQLEAQYTEAFNPDDTFVNRTHRTSSKASFAAYQGIAGLSWKMGERTQLDVTYRYLEAPKARFETVMARQYVVETDAPCSDCGGQEAKIARAVVVAPNASTLTVDETYGGQFSGRVKDQSITVGLRFAFGGKTKAPPPVVTEAPQHDEGEAPKPQPKSISAASSYGPQAPGSVQPRQFNVYFNFDSSRLDHDAHATIKDAAVYANDNNASAVLVTGHADTSGSKAYNVALSKRRATVVATELVTQGVPKPIIATAWKGEDSLEVQTRDGVALRQNRRTSIEVKF